MQPPGGHAICIDAAALCPNIPREQFRGQAVVCSLYRIGGVRTVEIGSAMLGKGTPSDSERSDSGVPARLELVRLAMPRRVYTQSHMDYAVEVCTDLSARRGDLRGLRMVYEPPILRHFTARFEEL